VKLRNRYKTSRAKVTARRNPWAFSVQAIHTHLLSNIELDWITRVERRRRQRMKQAIRSSADPVLARKRGRESSPRNARASPDGGTTNRVRVVDREPVGTFPEQTDVQPEARSSASQNEDRAAPSITSDDWLDAFEWQCTKELLKKARRCAAHRARKLSRAGGHVDDDYVHELVQDVLGDTLLGTLRWDPGSKSLQDHVIDAIATRVHHDVVRAARFPHVSLDAEDPESSHVVLAAADASLLAEQLASPETVRLAEDSFGELWELAADDPEVRLLLGALADGATCRDDVMIMTGMSEQDHHAARNRLDRLIARLSRNAQPSGRRSRTVPRRDPRSVAQRRPQYPALTSVPLRHLPASPRGAG
jgi:hypothetical protein